MSLYEKVNDAFFTPHDRLPLDLVTGAAGPRPDNSGLYL